MIRIELFITGDTARTARASSNLRRLCRAAGLDEDIVEIIDVIERPDLADHAGILATPTVIAYHSTSTRRVIGDLSDLRRLASALDLSLGDEDPGEAP